MKKKTFQLPEENNDFIRALGEGAKLLSACESCATVEFSAELPEQKVLEVNGVEIAFRLIPSGSFLMGSNSNEAFSDEGPVHEVTLTKPYWMMETTVTQRLWKAVMGANPSSHKDDNPESLDRPVVHVSWFDAREFAAKLSRITGLELDLPTEAQWERAARGGVEGKDRYGDLDEIAWCSNNSEGRTHKVAQKKPNNYGLYDMIGNVYEWCLDNKRTYTNDDQVDPIG